MQEQNEMSSVLFFLKVVIGVQLNGKVKFKMVGEMERLEV